MHRFNNIFLYTKDQANKYPYLFLGFLGAMIFIPFLGNFHLFDWDEANFAEIAREMIRSGNYLQPQINYLPFYEKPPIFIWMQVLSMKAFGINEFAARFPNALGGILTMWSLFFFGKKLKNQTFGWIWVMAYMGSILPFVYCRTGLIDPWFNLFMFWSIGLYFFASEFKSSLYFILSALALGLAVQTKGPVAMIIVGGTILGYYIWKGFEWHKVFIMTIWGVIVLIFSSIWFGVEYYHHGGIYFKEFITYQIRLFSTEDALHGGFFMYHPVVLWLGCFPAAVFIFPFKKDIEDEGLNPFRRLMIVCGVLVVVLFSIVQTKIVHYSSMAYYPITFIAACLLYQVWNKEIKVKRWQNVYIQSIITLIVCSLFLCSITLHLFNSSWHITTVEWGMTYVVISGILLCLWIVIRIKIYEERNKILSFFIFILLMFMTVMIVYLPNIEQEIQGPLIEFVMSKKGENADHVSLYMKSYAKYFYSDIAPFENKEADLSHLYYLYYPIDRDVYLYTKSKHKIDVDTGKIERLEYLYEKSGFEFYKRDRK